MFLRNAWYVAAWQGEIGRQPAAVQMLGERLVLYRAADGSVVALEDACPHRRVPLSMGRLQGDSIECGYHGLTFDRAGTCVRAPGSEKIPPAARVRSYPATERYGLVWIWMGDVDRADQDAIPAIEHWGDPDWGMNSGASMSVDCNYLYLTDNLLDPSHVAWVHPTSFGNEACEDRRVETSFDEGGVTVSRWLFDVEPAPFYAAHLKFGGRCDRKQHYEVRYPGVAIIKAVFTPAGTGGEGQSAHPDTFRMDSYNFLTPVTGTQTRYFWLQLRNFAPDDPDVSRAFAESVEHAFGEDRDILNAVQKGMDAHKGSELHLRTDFGALRFRQGLERLIGHENE